MTRNILNLSKTGLKFIGLFGSPTIWAQGNRPHDTPRLQHSPAKVIIVRYVKLNDDELCASQIFLRHKNSKEDDELLLDTGYCCILDNIQK